MHGAAADTLPGWPSALPATWLVELDLSKGTLTAVRGAIRIDAFPVWATTYVGNPYASRDRMQVRDLWRGVIAEGLAGPLHFYVSLGFDASVELVGAGYNGPAETELAPVAANEAAGTGARSGST